MRWRSSETVSSIADIGPKTAVRLELTDHLMCLPIFQMTGGGKGAGTLAPSAIRFHGSLAIATRQRESKTVRAPSSLPGCQVSNPGSTVTWTTAGKGTSPQRSHMFSSEGSDRESACLDTSYMLYAGVASAKVPNERWGERDQRGAAQLMDVRALPSLRSGHG